MDESIDQKNHGIIVKATAYIAAKKKRIATIALGHTFNQTFDWFFNYPLYMFVVNSLGFEKGYVLMALISFLVCLAFIRFYDWLKVDWLGIEVAKEVSDYGPSFIKNMDVKSGIGRLLWWPFSKIVLFILWAIKKGGVVAFFALSVYTDPFITTVYMRKGRYNGMAKKDWMIFISSTAVGNAYWAVRTFAILESAKLLWRSIAHS